MEWEDAYTNLLPLVVVALEQVAPVLDGDDACAARADLRLCRQRQVDACGEGYDGCGRRRVRVFAVAEWTAVEDAVDLLEVADCGVAEIDLGLLHPSGELRGIFVKILEVVLASC